MVVAAITMASCGYVANEATQPTDNVKLQFVVSDLPAFGQTQTGAVAPANMNVTNRAQATPMIVTPASTRNSGVQSCAIGTEDPGKTAWEEGDQLIVTLASKYYGEQSAILTFSDAVWSTDASFSYLGNETPIISAIYAPCYEVANGKGRYAAWYDGVYPGGLQHRGWSSQHQLQ